MFNYFHSNLIANKKLEDDEDIAEYLIKGFFKTKINSYALCKYISDEIKKETPSPINYGYHFLITEQMKTRIREHINNDFGPLLKKLEKFYNAKIAVANIAVKRNYHIDEKTNKEVYSNYYHIDSYTYNHFKIFINLTDVDIDQGPLHIYSKIGTKKFMKVNKYKDRNNYHNSELQDQLFCNTGKIRESLIANTTECIHKAGFVKKGFERDILFITFIAIPESDSKIEDNFFYYENKYSDDIWNNGNTVIKIAKPQSLKKTIKLFFQYFKYKLN